MIISAPAHVGEWPVQNLGVAIDGAAAELAGQHARPAAADVGKLRLLPYHMLLIVWSADMVLLALAAVLTRVAACRGAPWNVADMLLLALLPLGWLATAGRDLTRLGDAVSLRITARELAPAWPTAFRLPLLGGAAAAIVSSVLDGGGLAAIWHAGMADFVWLACLFACGLAFLTIGRPMVAGVLARVGGADLDRGGNLRLRALVVGSHADAARVAADLEDLPVPPLRVLGAVDVRGTLQEGGPVSGDGLDDRNLRVHAAAAHGMCELLRRAAIDTVLIAWPRDGHAGIAAILRTLRAAPVDIWLVPDAGDRAAGVRPGAQRLTQEDLSYTRLRGRPLSIGQQAAKKAEDMLAGFVLLLLATPVMLAIAVAIKLESSGPILFCQQRRGYGERLITVFKFRTMYETMRDDHAAQQTVRGDRRITRVGRLLRRLSLDELPQLINVMRGEMSVVGPRPHALQTKAAGQLFDAVVEDYAARHRVKPGITGWAQVNGWRGETDTVEKIVRRVEFDLFYIANWSVARDLAIMCKTVVRMPADRKAY
jgi:exopolysaccharide biosynthesis polyprenyl glycosylphosphotransferase